MDARTYTVRRPEALLWLPLSLVMGILVSLFDAAAMASTASDLLARCEASGRSSQPPSPEEQNKYYVTYSSRNDEVRSVDHPHVEHIDGGDGDDIIIVTERRDFLGIEAGRGADTVVVCGPTALSLQINLAGGRLLGSDAKRDVLVLGPEVFLGCCQTNSNQSPQGQRGCPLCGAETAPLSESGGSVLLEIGSGVEAAFLVEMV